MEIARIAKGLCCDALCAALNVEDGEVGVSVCVPLCDEVEHTVENFCPALCGKIFSNPSSKYTVCKDACDGVAYLCGL